MPNLRNTKSKARANWEKAGISASFVAKRQAGGRILPVAGKDFPVAMPAGSEDAVSRPVGTTLAQDGDGGRSIIGRDREILADVL
jgi:hypothetical protein